MKWVYIILLLIGTGCKSQPSTNETTQYVRHVDAWHANRITRLKAPEGWLSLAGLFWLEPGHNTVGSAPENHVVLPRGPATMGHLVRDEVGVRFVGTNGVQMPLLDDHSESPTKVDAYGAFFYVIRRGDKVGIRVKDPQQPQRTAFNGIPRFPVDPGARVLATFKPHETPQTLDTVNVLGDAVTMSSPGVLEFNWKGQTFTLAPAQNSPTDDFFLVIGDLTNGTTTYGGGRFLYAAPSSDGSEVVLDFNKLYNPPCAYTPYATCPRPPDANQLSVAIEAGEKVEEPSIHH